MTSHRLFFALWPDDDVREGLLRWQSGNLSAQARWQHRDDLHMTLHFLGEVDRRRIPELEALGGLCAGPGFSMFLDRIGFWRRVRVLWAAPAAAPEPLMALHGRLQRGLDDLGMRTEDRSYRPHVTLARGMREEPPVSPLPPLAWSVREMVLVESRRGPPPVYHPLARWSLRTGSAEHDSKKN